MVYILKEYSKEGVYMHGSQGNIPLYMLVIMF